MAAFDDRDPQLTSGANRPPIPHPQAIVLGGEALKEAATKYNAERADAIRKSMLERLAVEVSALNTDVLNAVIADTGAPGAEVWTAVQPLIDDHTLVFGSRGWRLSAPVPVEVKQ